MEHEDVGIVSCTRGVQRGAQRLAWSTDRARHLHTDGTYPCTPDCGTRPLEPRYRGSARTSKAPEDLGAIDARAAPTKPKAFSESPKHHSLLILLGHKRTI